MSAYQFDECVAADFSGLDPVDGATGVRYMRTMDAEVAKFRSAGVTY